MSRASVRDRVVTAAYKAGWRALRALPEPVALSAFRLGADVATRRNGKGVQRLTRNLERVAPGQDLTRAAVRSYARYWCEVFRLPSVGPEKLVAGTTRVNEERFREALARPEGVVLALPHTGNWDAAGAWCGVTGAPFTTVAERLEPAGVFEEFLAFRRSLGMEVLPLTGGERSPHEVLTERLQAGGTLCLVGDRDLSARGVDVTFFGEAARMPAGPASLALATGATLFPVTLSFTERGWRIEWHDAIPHTDVATMTQVLADAFAVGIAAYPADWHMLQRFFLADLEPRP